MPAQTDLIDPHTGQPVQWSDVSTLQASPNAAYDLQGLLQQAGLWEGFTSAPNRTNQYGAGVTFGGYRGGDTRFDDARADVATTDWDRLKGYTIGTSRKDYELTKYLRDPSGKIVGQTSWADEGPSLRSDDYAKMAAVVLGGYGAASALGGAGVGAGVGAGAGATEAGVVAGNGAFLGEGVASGVGAWDAAVPAAMGGTAEAGAGAGMAYGGGDATVVGEGAGYGGEAASPWEGGGFGQSAGGTEGAVTDPSVFNPEGITNPNFGQNADFAMVNGMNGGGLSSLSASSLAGWGDILKGGIGLYQAYGLNKASRGTQSSRIAEAQLAQLLQNPDSITSMPGYEAGLDAVERRAAGQGYLGSGNLKIALAKYGGDFYNQSVSQLSGIANRNYATDQQYKFGSLQLLGQGLNSMAYGFSQLGIGG